ncbi:enterobactin transporter EntS [Streptomyces sp. NPDC056500]|uniref:enterobactin transporter EntS n=1 Tax=Streptomyces sp. NPDC056500 TaxID=3345840 RepID=UPI0036AF7B61
MGRLVLDVTPLRGRAFRYVFIARTVAVFGLGFAMVAVPLQVYSLTGSTVGVASVSVAVGIAAFVGTLLGGVLADRADRRRVILVARSAAGLAFAVLAVNAALPEQHLWVIYLCGMVEGIADGVSGTALMAATPGLVAQDKLPAAGALLALMADLGSATAPALGGLLVTATDFWVNYAVCAGAGVITVSCLTRLPSMPPTEAARSETVLQSLGAGIRFVSRDRIVGPALLVGVIAMVLSGWSVLLPEYGEQVLKVGPEGLGLLYAAPAIGALIGSLTSGWTGTVRRTGALAIGAVLVSAVGLATTGLGGGLIWALVGLAVFGIGRLAGDVLRFTIVQENTPDQFRGRVAGLWTAQVTTGIALGAAVAGGISTVASPRDTFVLYAAVGVVSTLVAAMTLPTLRKLVRSL